MGEGREMGRGRQGKGAGRSRGSGSSALGFSFLAALGLMAFLAAGAQAATPSHIQRPALSHDGFTSACGVATDSNGDLYVAPLDSFATTNKENR